MRHYKKKSFSRLIKSKLTTYLVVVLSISSLGFFESFASEAQVLAPTSTLKLPSEIISTSQQYTLVKNAVFNEAYSQRPNYKVNRTLFGKANNDQDNKLLKAANRTLTDSRDLLNFPSKQKLLQANGICFAGIWNIDKNSDNNFAGLFSSGTSQSVIVRASVALSGTKQKDKRAFGMAIKFFPDDLKTSPSINAFLLNSFGGVVSKHVLDLPMDNQPTLGSLPKLSDIGTALRLKKDLEKADRTHSDKKPRFSFRPITHLASYQNLNNTKLNKSPKWLRLTAKTSQRIDANDFRDELDVAAYAEKKIVYDISVAIDTSKKSQARWQTIGLLSLNESITSATCDRRLHFQHPLLD